VKTTFLGKIIALALLILLLASVQVFAAEQGVLRFQGKMMNLSLRKAQMTVNERKVVWDSKSLFYDEKGSPAKVEALKRNNWVYIVAIRQKNKPILIQKLYLLPKYIKKNEKHFYPFMQ
jgi:hypothetical protein